MKHKFYILKRTYQFPGQLGWSRDAAVPEPGCGEFDTIQGGWTTDRDIWDEFGHDETHARNAITDVLENAFDKDIYVILERV